VIRKSPLADPCRHVPASFRCGDAMSSNRPSAEMCPSFPSASIRTVQFVTSTKTLAIGTESGPGLIVPVTFEPSQFITTVTWFRRVALGPQSPVQVPVNGWPSCASPGAASLKHAHRQPRMKSRLRMGRNIALRGSERNDEPEEGSRRRALKVGDQPASGCVRRSSCHVLWQSGHTKYAVVAVRSTVEPGAPQVGHAEAGRMSAASPFSCQTTFCRTLGLCWFGAISQREAKIAAGKIARKLLLRRRSRGGMLETETVKLARFTRTRGPSRAGDFVDHRLNGCREC